MKTFALDIKLLLNGVSRKRNDRTRNWRRTLANPCKSSLFMHFARGRSVAQLRFLRTAQFRFPMHRFLPAREYIRLRCPLTANNSEMREFLNYSRAGAAKINNFRSGLQSFLNYSCLFSDGIPFISGKFAGGGPENILISVRRSHHFLNYSRVEAAKKCLFSGGDPIISRLSAGGGREN